MTADEKLQIFRDRLSGLSYKEIEKKYGVSKKEIIEMLSDKRVGCTRQRCSETCIYPVLFNWIYDHFGSSRKFAAAVGVSNTCVINWLCGKTDISKKNIDKMLEIAGMPYEQLFKQKGDHENDNI